MFARFISLWNNFLTSFIKIYLIFIAHLTDVAAIQAMKFQCIGITDIRKSFLSESSEFDITASSFSDNLSCSDFSTSKLWDCSWFCGSCITSLSQEQSVNAKHTVNTHKNFLPFHYKRRLCLIINLQRIFVK